MLVVQATTIMPSKNVNDNDKLQQLVVDANSRGYITTASLCRFRRLAGGGGGGGDSEMLRNHYYYHYYWLQQHRKRQRQRRHWQLIQFQFQLQAGKLVALCNIKLHRRRRPKPKFGVTKKHNTNCLLLAKYRLEIH